MRVLCVGEVMVELSGIQADGAALVGFGGDTCNTAIYLARLMGPGQVGYLTRLGAEPFGAQIVDRLAIEHVALSDATMVAGRQTGLYAITLDDAGERSFTYWRDAAPARDLLSGAGAATEQAWLDGCDALYLSGITLAVMRDPDQMIAAMQARRDAGQTVMFDTNLRPALWARNHPNLDLAVLYKRAAGAASIVKTGADEIAEIFGGGSARDHLDCAQIVTTDGHGAVICSVDGRDTTVPIAAVDRVVDATAAGDSFNAGYLAATLDGAAPEQAILSGHALAATVIGHHGAIIPVNAMP